MKVKKSQLQLSVNIYRDPNDLENIYSFTFFTENNVLSGFTPLNTPMAYISAIVEVVIGKKLPFDEGLFST